MGDSSISALTRRIERLEGQLRRWRLAGGVSLLAVALLGVAGSGSDAEVRTQMLTVMGKDGRPRAHLAEGGDGQVVLGLLDGARRTRASLFVGRDGPVGLAFADAAGKPRLKIDLLADPKGRSGLALLDANQKPRAELVIQTDGASAIQLSGADGAALFKAP